MAFPSCDVVQRFLIVDALSHRKLPGLWKAMLQSQKILAAHIQAHGIQVKQGDDANKN